MLVYVILWHLLWLFLKRTLLASLVHLTPMYCHALSSSVRKGSLYHLCSALLQYERPYPGVMYRVHERPTGELASLRVYEAHVGMSSEEPKVASYTEFKGILCP